MAQEGSENIYTWSLLSNHFHLLVKTQNRLLASSMRKILTGYVVNFNKRHRRILGDNEFVAEITSGLDDLLKRNLRLSSRRIDIDSAAEKACKKYDISKGELDQEAEGMRS